MTQRYTFALLLWIVFFAAPAGYAQCPITVSAGEDIYLCAPPSPTQLNGSIDGDYLNFSWSPTSGMAGANTLNPTVTVTSTKTFVLTARAADYSNNLISNGDFESGNTDFTSDYTYNPGDLVPEGFYDVLTNPQDDHPGFAPCDDHTSGDGNMMVVNGAGTPNQNVWCQTVTVTPNTQYVFSAWVTSVVASSPALLQFSINGAPLGNIFSAPGGTCNWVNFFQIWNSGGNGSATICIVNQNTTLGGNDFALDDILFAPTCQVSDTVTVHVINIAAAASPAITFIPCDGANVTLSGAGSSTGPNITYEWDTPNGNIVSGQNTLSPVVNSAGTYTLTVTYDNGLASCTKTATVSVAESPNPLSAWINPANPIGCGSNTSLLVGNSSQPAFSTYQWTAGPGGNIVSGGNAKIATVDQPGDYTLLVTNTATGCTATAEITVTSATNPPTASASVSDTISCIQTTAALSGAGSTSGPNIAYAWTTPNGSIVSGQNAQNAVAGAGGMYILAVTNTSNNCAAYDTVVVVADTLSPVVNIAPPGNLDCDTDTLTLSATVNPANGAVIWGSFGPGTIVSGQNTLNPQVISVGIYDITATNPANGCTATASILVNSDYSPPVAVAQPADSITCQSPTVTLTGNGSSAGPNFIYAWSAGAGGNIVSGQNTLNPVVNAPASYTLLVTNTVNACTATVTVPVVADTNIVIAVANAPDTLTCAVNSVTLNTNGSSSGPAMTYNWTTSDGNITGGANTPAPTADAPGTYQLLLTNTANGCSATDLAVVELDVAAPDVQIDPPGLLTCSNPTQTIQAQNLSLPGNFVYSWAAPPGGNIVSGDSTLNPVVNAPGVYVLTTTNTGNGCAASDSVAVTLEAGTPVAVAATPGPITCADTIRILNSNGSSSGPEFTFNWTTSDGNIIAGANTPAPVVDQAGAYNLLITNTSNGCTATTSVSVGDNTTLPPADAGPGGILTCTQPALTLIANDTSSNETLLIQWETSGGNIAGDPANDTISCDQAGLYILTVTDPANGCTAADTIQVTANQQQPALSIAAPATLTCLATTVTLTATASGNSLFFYWQTPDGQFVSGDTTAFPVVNAPGAYNVTVTDQTNGCSNSSGVSVAQDTVAPSVAIAPPPVLTCVLTQFTLSGDGTGNATWSTADGNIVSGGDQFGNCVVNAPGTYTLSSVDPSNGCTASVSVTVWQDVVLPNADAGANDTLTCNINSLIINGSGSGSGSLTFAWTASGGGNIVSGQNTPTPVADAPGIYSLLVTNSANGCTTSDAMQIFEDADAPQADAGAAAILTCAVAQTTLNATASAGPNFTYNWTASGGGNIVSGQNTLNPVVDEAGTYTLTVNNNNNGCAAVSQVIVDQNITPPPAGVGPPGLLTCAITSLNLAGSPLNGNYTWSWQTSDGNIVSGANSPDPVIDQPGAYTLVVTDLQNGCSAAAYSVVSEDVAAPAISAAAPQTLTCAVLNVPVNGSVMQPASGYTAAWATADGHIVSGQNALVATVDQPGTYVLTVQNMQNGCTSAAQTIVNQNITPPLAQASATAPITCANPVVSLSGAGSSVGPGYAYAWSGGQITGGQNTLIPTVSTSGTYTLTVTDQGNGCTSTATAFVGENTTAPAVVIPAPEMLTCIQLSVALTANLPVSLPDFSANWTTANGHFISGQNSLFPVVDQPGVYVVTVHDLQNGCSTTAQTTVLQDITLPGADAGAAPELHCNQPQATLQGSSPATGNMTYSWSTANGSFVSGTNVPNPVVDAPGSYTLTVTNPANGCTSTDAVVVTEVPPPSFTPELMQPDCHHPKGALDLGAVSGGAAPFSYSVNGGQSFQNQPFFSNLPPGDYDLVVRDAYGCTAVAAAMLNAPFIPEVDLEDWILIQLGDSVVLQPVLNQPVANIVSWQWSPPEGLSCTDCPAPEAKPLRPTVYTLKIIDINGCEAEAKIQLRVDRRRILYAPNIFTPNGDGLNDVFTLYGRGVREIQRLQIFDRWGAELFIVEHLQVNDELLGWNGTFRGTALNPAVFVWQAVVEFEDGEVEVFSGDVTLAR